MVSVILSNSGYESAFATMVNNMLCPKNCSGNGDCLSGTCMCHVQYTGWSCSDSNLGYYITFGVLFYLISVTCIIQLIMRIRSELIGAPSPSIYRACKLDIQKLIYLFVICASGSRAVYFTLGIHDIMPEIVRKNLFSIFYPFVLSGFSLIICIWAESFHLSGLQLDKPRFLTKSFCGFLAFNVLVYVTLIAQLISNNVLHISLSSKLNGVFNGCFAFLMFFVLVFFLIYGVEIFYKVKGAFMPHEVGEKRVNVSQLFQSRMGLLFQGAFQLAVTMFLMSDVLGEMWKQNLSIKDNNIVEIAFHVAELACALWFPCCFWNVDKPGKLWIINPKNLLTHRNKHEDVPIVCETPSSSSFGKDIEINKLRDVGEDDDDANSSEIECWICYDKDKTDEMIQPCNCKGDMKLVHHDCLKVWLVEKSMVGLGGKTQCCSVCKAEYEVTSDGSIFWTPNKVQFRAWAQTFFVVATMASLPVTIFFVWNKIHQAAAKTAIVIFMFLAEYCLLRLLGFNFVKAYNITRTRALKILGKHEFVRQRVSESSSDDGIGQVEIADCTVDTMVTSDNVIVPVEIAVEI